MNLPELDSHIFVGDDLAPPGREVMDRGQGLGASKLFCSVSTEWAVTSFLRVPPQGFFSDDDGGEGTDDL